MNPALAQHFLLYGVLPLWLAAGTADALCHRWANLPETAGVRESLMHIAQLTEGAGVVLCALFLQINAFAIVAMAALIVVHHLTVYADLRYASATRVITPVEQMVHSVLEMAPIVGLAIICLAHPDVFARLFDNAAGYTPAWRDPPLSSTTVTAVLMLCAIFGVVPYAMELAASIRASRKRQRRKTGAASESVMR
ncbi:MULTISPECIES: hypothetical protein [Caballeronia]|uniref:Diguanylate cyclase n=1 Tax=Caballeronia zhejiangensis TaxID=871203 RepID=A0A656QSA7_9BURK|nr:MULTISPECIES: hypothetical protein [Caballeronia]EKS71407.1 hypothetical protein BURK_010536 [Burkholderia sp. SJ98]KDR31985.1 diguanylate cyclase [Caballeronia zhejiangensis]MDR5790409.1 diguanylate cyclase [Caballeronia sp. LP003]